MKRIKHVYVLSNTKDESIRLFAKTAKQEAINALLSELTAEGDYDSFGESTPSMYQIKENLKSGYGVSVTFSDTTVCLELKPIFAVGFGGVA